MSDTDPLSKEDQRRLAWILAKTIEEDAIEEGPPDWLADFREYLLKPTKRKKPQPKLDLAAVVKGTA